MKKVRIKNILLSVIFVSAILVCIGIGTVFSKYVFSYEVGSFDLKVVPRVRLAEAIMKTVPEDGTLTRIVYDYWNNGYTDSSVTPAVTIGAEEWLNEGYDVYDPSQPNIRMFAKQHDGVNFTVYVLSAEDIVAPKDSSYMLSGSKYGGALADSVTEIVMHNFHFPDDITKIANMFNGCTKLTKLDLSGMDFRHIKTKADITTANANNDDRGDFFRGTNIKELDISYTKWSGHMGTFFYRYNGGRQGLTTVEQINMTGIDTTEVTYLHSMFRGMTKLTDIIGFSDFDISNVTSVRELFYDCRALKSEYFVTFGNLLEQGNITSLRQTFYQCYNFNNDALYAVFDGLAGDGTVSKTISLYQTFQYCNDITSVDLSTVSNVDSIDVSNLYQTFYGCSDMTSITLPQISSVTTMEKTFYNCDSLHTVNLSFVNTSLVTNTVGMFAYSENLTTVCVGDGWTTANVTSSSNMFTGCSKIVGGNGTTYDANYIDKTYARIDGKDGLPGYFRSTYTLPEAADLKTKIANNKIKDKTLTKIVFDYWDPANGYTAAGITADEWSEGIDLNQPGTIKMFPQANGSESTMYILSEKDITAPINSRYLFAGKGNPDSSSQSYGTMQKVKEIVFNNFYLPNGVAADHLFYECTALSSLTLSNWAENIQDDLNLDSAFYNCKALTSLDLSGLAKDTLKNISLNGAFQNCSALTSLDFSAFSICPLEKLSLKSAFNGCSSLSSLDLSYLAKNTLKELDLKSAFSGCRSFTSLDLSSFAVANGSLTRLDMNDTFNGCTSLESLDLSRIDFTIHANIFDNSSFSNLSSLKTLDFSNTTWWYGNITYIWTMKTVEKVDFTGINTEEVNNMADVFNGWSNLREIIGIADLDTAKLTDLGETFKGCSSLEDKYFAEFAQALAKGNSVQNLSYAFNGCTKMSNESFNAIIDALNTGKVTTVTGAFSNCTGLSGTLDMSRFDMTGVTDDYSTMFTGCTNVTSIIWPGTEVEMAVGQSVGVNIDLSGVTNALITANGNFISAMLYTENNALCLDIEADEGYILPDTFTVDIDGTEYPVNTVGDENLIGILFDKELGSLFISDDLLSQGSLMKIQLVCVEDVPVENPDVPTEGEQPTFDTEEPPVESEQTPTDDEDSPADDEQNPTDGEESTSNDAQAPTDGQGPPGNDGQVPADNEAPPVDDEQVPAENE